MRHPNRPGRGPDSPDFLKGLAAGLIAGAAGGLAMMAAQTVAARAAGLPLGPGEFDVAQDAAARRRPDGSPEPSPVRTARTLTRAALGRDPLGPRGWAAGQAFHLAFGAALGGAYGVLVEYAPAASLGAGLPFGAAQVLLADPIAAPALGLADSPRRAPAVGWLGSLAAHATYGLATEAVRRRVRPLL